METKWFLKSKTIIGVVISIIPALLPALGVHFTADDASFVSTNVDHIIQGVGAVLAIYGRFVAKGPTTVAP